MVGRDASSKVQCHSDLMEMVTMEVLTCQEETSTMAPGHREPMKHVTGIKFQTKTTLFSRQ
jgi:hypothetical protein